MTEIREFKAPLNCLAGLAEVWNGQYDFVGLQTSGEPPVILDIGANCGAFSLWCLLVHWPKATIHAYEPNPEVFNYLKANCSPRVQCHAFAVGDPSLNYLSLPENKPLHARLSELPGVLGFSVSTIHPNRLPVADLIKIDAEGSEGFIVENLACIPKLLVLEWHGDEQRRRVENAMAGKMQLVEAQSRGAVGILKYIKI